MNFSFIFKRSQKCGEVVGQLAVKEQLPAVGVDKAYLFGVQTLAAKRGDDLLRAVDRVARDGVTDVRHMHADLVSSACLKPQRDVSEALIAVKHAVVRHGGARGDSADGHLLALANLAAFALLWRVQPQAAAVNFINGAFSLLPCLGLDGGDIAFAALCRVFGPRAAQITLKAHTVAVAAALTALGARLFIDAGNPTLCLTGLYLGAAEILKSTSRL